MDGETDALAFAHESVHAMDDIDPEFGKRSAEFFERRTEGKKLKPLRELTGNENYKKEEVAFEVNDTYDPYAYKYYRKGEGSEVSSMGVQDVYLDPEGLRNADPELFRHAIWLLLHG